MTSSASAPLRFVVLLTSVAVALLLLLTGVIAPASADDGLDEDAVTITSVYHEVVAGDTLWDIAAGFTPPGDDVRRTIHDIKVINDLGSSEIQVGQLLAIPVSF